MAGWTVEERERSRAAAGREGARILIRTEMITGVPVDEIVGYDRDPPIRDARILAALAMKSEGYSWPDVGMAIGGREHQTMMRICANTDVDVLRKRYGHGIIKRIAGDGEITTKEKRTQAWTDARRAAAALRWWKTYCRREYKYSWRAQEKTPPFAGWTYAS